MSDTTNDKRIEIDVEEMREDWRQYAWVQMSHEEADALLNKIVVLQESRDKWRELAMADDNASLGVKRIEITEENISMAGSASIITARFSRVQFHREEHIKISTDLYANEIDDMIALLTAAKAEMARREAGR